jgi:predicted secreted protein
MYSFDKITQKPAVMIYADPSFLLRKKEGFKKFPMSCKAAKMGVKLICGGALLDDVQEYARNYAKENNGLLLPFGLDDPNFKGLLVEALRESIPQKIREERMVLWTIVGSGLLLNVFYEVFPNAFIMGVRAGKPIYFDSIDPSRTFTITTRYRFTQVPDILPPYPGGSAS